MSTKIYNGRIIRSRDFVAIKQDLEQLRKRALEIAYTYIDEFVYNMTLLAMLRTTKLDKGELPPNTKMDTYKWAEEPFWAARSYAEAEIRKSVASSSRGDSFLDLTYNLVLIPLKKADRTLVVPYIQNRALEKVHIGEEYGYWDNTDPDEKVSKEEWNQRRKDWNVLGHDAVSSYGFVYEMITESMLTMHFWETFSMEKDEIEVWKKKQLAGVLKAVAANKKDISKKQIVEAMGKTIYQAMFPKRS